jgi:hypothetical protein
MSKLLIPMLLIVVLASACSGPAPTLQAVDQQVDSEAKPVVTLFRPPT